MSEKQNQLAAANSLLEEGTPGDITTATQQDQGEDHLAEGQQDDSTKADESDLLDHGLTLVSHGFPLDPGHYDTDAADLFLEVLGFGRQDPVILSAGGDNYWRIPRKPKGGYDWKQVAAHAAHGRDWPGFLRLLKERPNACFQSNIGGTKNEEIFGGWLLVYEIDRYDKDKQFGLWEAAGLQWEADELRRKAGIAEMQRMNERIDESRQVQQQAAQRREEWQSMGILERMGHQPLSPEVISRNRREWGITGQ